MKCVCACVGLVGVCVFMCLLWRGHFYVAPCHVAPLSFGGGGGWLDF